MAEKRKRWRKSWEDKWRDEASDTLDLVAKALRALLGDVAELEVGSDVGWAVDGQGRPYDSARLARLLSATEEQVRAAEAQLISAGVALREGNRLGLAGWRQTQEDPSAKRQREHRSKAGRDSEGDADRDNQRDSHSDNNAQRTEDRGQRTELTEQADDARACASEPGPTPGNPPQARRPVGEVPGSSPESRARDLLLELSQLFVPTQSGRAIEARRIKTSDLRALERAERLLRVPLDGLDEDAARRMLRERFEHVITVCREFAAICAADPVQAAFWKPTMLEVDRTRGRDRSAWDVVESVVADRQQPRVATARGSPVTAHVPATKRNYGNGTQDL